MAESRKGFAETLRPEFKKVLLDQQGAAVFLWAFFISAIFLYLWIAQLVLTRSSFPLKFSFSEEARIVVWFLVLVDLAYLIWWKRRYLTQEAIFSESKKMKLLRALEGHRNRLEEKIAGVVSSYITRKIVAFAIIEAIAVYGLVLALIGRYLWDQYLFSAASAVLLTLEFPSKGFLEGLVNETEGLDLSAKG